MQKYWVDKKVLKHFFKFFSTYAIKDYIPHIILVPNGSYYLKTFKFKYFKTIYTQILLKNSIFQKTKIFDLLLNSRFGIISG